MNKCRWVKLLRVQTRFSRTYLGMAQSNSLILSGPANSCQNYKLFLKKVNGFPEREDSRLEYKYYPIMGNTTVEC